ncbi:hypothetical protein [Haloarchaeobius sp. TZWWS8]|uniref:hypothetical protein n=1 Tax=Haloarchaeobius sp. TZWWS8 TaxID=3446121 RepID=UPI003EB7136E
MVQSLAQEREQVSPVLRLLSSQDRVEILCTFLEHPIDTFSARDISEPIDVDADTVEDHVIGLMALGIVEQVPAGRSAAGPVFRLNLDNDITEVLLELDEVIFRTVDDDDDDGRPIRC